MRYKVSVQHTSDHELDGVWYAVGHYDDAATAIYEHLKFQEFYGRPVKIDDAQYRFEKGHNDS